MAFVLSLNVGRAVPSQHTDVGVTGIDKRPVDGPVDVRAPGTKRGGLGSGLVGDAVCDRRHHGGDDQAVYAYAREDLDGWAARLGRPLASGSFGENLTTSGIDLTAALIGERWRVGAGLVLEVSCPRIPCRTFAGWLGEQGWVKTFTAARVPGAYLRVAEPGSVRRGDPIDVVARPAHDVSIGVVFRALTGEAHLLERVLEVGALPEAECEGARRLLQKARSA
ncbi:MAG TPA: MOSC domain-containing protein [Kofleriaceae bacterium]|nr:MOSC domain-containing protein [Kofleriaceae bacterium]